MLDTPTAFTMRTAFSWFLSWLMMLFGCFCCCWPVRTDCCRTGTWLEFLKAVSHPAFHLKLDDEHPAGRIILANKFRVVRGWSSADPRLRYRCHVFKSNQPVQRWTCSNQIDIHGNGRQKHRFRSDRVPTELNRTLCPQSERCCG